MINFILSQSTRLLDRYRTDRRTDTQTETDRQKGHKRARSNRVTCELKTKTTRFGRENYIVNVVAQINAFTNGYPFS